MDEKFNSILSIALVPQIVDLIVQKEGMDDISRNECVLSIENL